VSTRFKNTTGVYIIAEVGINHNGDIAEAKRLIDAAVDAGANGVKIQVRNLSEIYSNAILNDSLKAEQGTQYLLNELKKAHLTQDQVVELVNHAKKFPAIDFFATPFDRGSALFLSKIGMELYKVGSPDFSNLPLIETICQFKKPIILSTGMSDESEIEKVVAFLKKIGADFSLLHCNSTYPASYEDINLNYIPVLKKVAGTKVGYSGHEQGFAPTLAAVALGAEIIERHITFDRQHSGPDHSASLTPSEFRQMVEEIRRVTLALGKPHRVCSQGEKNNRLSLAKSLVAAHDLSAGTVLTGTDLIGKSPAKGVSPLYLDEFLGKTLSCDLKQDDYIFQKHIEGAGKATQTSFEINRTWGIVGRLNDYRDFIELKPDLFEIHMTWRDLNSYTPPTESLGQDLVVHAPEYYQDKLIDFASDDPKILELSTEMLKKTIQIARDLNPHFKGQKDPRGPRVVVHPGGHFSKKTTSNRSEQYRRLMKSLKQIDSSGVRILVENMPPFPWYFGGQWYNSIFMDPHEIRQFADEMKWGICYDTSHALLYCNSVKMPLREFTKAVSDISQYLHISDAKGTTDEGLQLGSGDIDFEHLQEILTKINVGFIPEIWQGHLNRGQGFKEALVIIEKLLKKSSGTSCSDEAPHSH
jgi:sialic acid synthase SpsE/endonuclease IV